jgi:hypothetical protein
MKDSPKKLMIGQSRFETVDSIPEKWQGEMKAVLETARSIHGDKFVNHVKFLLNLDTLISLMVNNTTLNAGITKNQITHGLTELGTQLAGSHAMLSNLNEQLQIEAMNVQSTVDSIVKQYEAEINKKG